MNSITESRIFYKKQNTLRKICKISYLKEGITSMTLSVDFGVLGGEGRKGWVGYPLVPLPRPPQLGIDFIIGLPRFLSAFLKTSFNSFETFFQSKTSLLVYNVEHSFFSL